MASTDPLAADAPVSWRRAERTLWRRTLTGVVVLPALHAHARRARMEASGDAPMAVGAGVGGGADAGAGVQPVALRGPAAGIWELLAKPMTHTALVAALATEYGVSEDQVATDVGGALDVLHELGALCRS